MNALTLRQEKHSSPKLQKFKQTSNQTCIFWWPHVSIKEIFKDASRLEIHASNEDIKAYLQGRIETMSRLKRQIAKDPEMENKIITTIVGNAQGMSVSLTRLLPNFADILIGFS